MPIPFFFQHPLQELELCSVQVLLDGGAPRQEAVLRERLHGRGGIYVYHVGFHHDVIRCGERGFHRLRQGMQRRLQHMHGSYEVDPRCAVFVAPHEERRRFGSSLDLRGVRRGGRVEASYLAERLRCFGLTRALASADRRSCSGGGAGVSAGVERDRVVREGHRHGLVLLQFGVLLKGVLQRSGAGRGSGA